MKTPRDYFFEVIKKKGDIEIRSSITAQINEEDFIRVMEEYANLKVKAVLPQANVSGSCLFIHKWTKWEQHGVNMSLVKDGKEYPYIKTIQTRKCLRCNKMQKEDI